MSALAPVLQGFFTDRLARQRQASPHTVAAYRDSLRLLIVYAARILGKQTRRHAEDHQAGVSAISPERSPSRPRPIDLERTVGARQHRGR
jgi:site-specific recombinase XerC